MSLAVTVLGSSAMFSTVERASSGYLLELGTERYLLDAGGGTYRNMLSSIEYQQVDGVILTHRHPDHTIDVFQLYHARQYGRPDPLPPIPLWAPAETIEKVTAFISEVDQSFELHTVGAGDAVDIAGAKVSFTQMAHPAETLGVRIERDEVVLAYSADTGPAADFHALASVADLFICEATFQDSDELWEGHLSAAQAARIAGDVGARKLLLTHLPAGRDLELSLREARAVDAVANIELAYDGMRIEVGA